MRKVIAVYDGDPVYAENLVRGLLREEGFPYEPVLFTEAERFLSYVRDTPECMILTDPDFGRAAKEELRGRRKVYLTDEQGTAGTDQVPRVFRYQPLPKLCRALLLAFSGDAESILPEKEPGAALLTVVSPVGRCGKTGFARTLGRLLAQRERVLCMSLSYWSGFSNTAQEDCSGDLSDFLYACETGRDFGDADPEEEDVPGLELIAPVSMPEDLFRADPKTVLHILDRLIKKRSVRTAVLDLCTEERLMRTFLPLSREIYVPSLRDQAAEDQTAEFLSWVLRTFGEEVHARCRVLYLPEPPRFMNAGEGTDGLLWSEVGDFTRRLIGGNY